MFFILPGYEFVEIYNLFFLRILNGGFFSVHRSQPTLVMASIRNEARRSIAEEPRSRRPRIRKDAFNLIWAWWISETPRAKRAGNPFYS